MEEDELALSPLEGTIPVDHQQYLHPHHNIPVFPQQIPAEYSFGAWNIIGSDQMIPLTNNLSEIEAPNCFAKSGDEEESPWSRVKWTDEMVKFLITALSYITDDTSSSFFGGTTREIIARKGKWRTISKVLGKRGFRVSPQQCEDKYNDLNKRYRRLVDLLGRGVSCDVVETPYILEFMDISEKSKDEVRKLLANKQLFYKEMCSYHNKNRLFLPEDEDLRKLLKLVLQGKNDEDWNANCNLRKPMLNVNSSKGKGKEGEEVVWAEGAVEEGKQDRHIMPDNDEVLNANYNLGKAMVYVKSLKGKEKVGEEVVVLAEGAVEEEGRLERRIMPDNDEGQNANYNLGKAMVNVKSSKGKEKVGEEVVLAEGAREKEARQKRRIMPDNYEYVNANYNLGKLNMVSGNSPKRNINEGEESGLAEGAGDVEGRLELRIIELQNQSLRLQAQMLELKQEELMWQRICQHGDMRLGEYRLENEFLKLENARLSNELKRRRISKGNN